MWQELFIKNKDGHKLYVDHYFESHDAPNIIYIQTPVVSVTEYKMAYEPLSKYGFNIFALDLSGIGKSEGDVNKFSISKVESDIDTCIDYIKSNFSNDIHMYGGTGTGATFAQYYVCHKNNVASFAQYGVAIFDDVSHMEMMSPMLSTMVVKLFYTILKGVQKILPKVTFKLSLPKYDGKNAEMENSFYADFVKFHPKIFNMKISLLKSYLGMFFEKDSHIRNSPKCPTLVFESLHDRYYPVKYYRDYYNSLTCEKKLYSIDDVHNSYIFHNEEVCEVIAKWFSKHTNKKAYPDLESSIHSSH